MKKVIRLNENDLEKIIKKILKENSLNELNIEGYKGLTPAVAEIDGIKKIVIVDENNKVVAIGPSLSYIKGDKNKFCEIASKLINELFDKNNITVEGIVNEIQNIDFTNIKRINFCDLNESTEETPKNLWWGYKHTSGTYQAKRYFEPLDIEQI